MPPAILAFILEDKLIPAERAVKCEHVRLKALVSFDVEVELHEEIQQFADGTFMIPPKDALRLPAIEEAKRKIAMGNCQAKFKTFEISVVYEKAETAI